MALPALNTGGVDITNTLAKIEAMKTNKVQRDNAILQNRLLEKQLDPKAETRRNTIEKLNLESATYKHAKEGLGWVDAAAESGKSEDFIPAYVAYRKNMIEGLGISPGVIPKYETFFDEKEDLTDPSGKTRVFNKDRYYTWSSRAAATEAERFALKNKAPKGKMEILYGPDGKTIQTFVKDGEDFDPAKIYGPEWSFVKPEKVSTSKPIQVIGPDGKRVWTTPEEAIGQEAPTPPAVQANIIRGAAQEETVRHNKALEAAKAMPNVKESLSTADGRVLVVMQDGTAKVKQGNRWVQANEEDLTGVTKIGTPQSEIEKLLADIIRPEGKSEKVPSPKKKSVTKITGAEAIQSAIDQANEAIAQGADPEAVKKRLKDMGIEVQ